MVPIGRRERILNLRFQNSEITIKTFLLTKPNYIYHKKCCQQNCKSSIVSYLNSKKDYAKLPCQFSSFNVSLHSLSLLVNATKDRYCNIHQMQMIKTECQQKPKSFLFCSLFQFLSLFTSFIICILKLN